MLELLKPSRLSGREKPEDGFDLLRMTASSRVHEIAIDLLVAGERRMGPDCLSLAAGHEHPGAEVDLLIWRSSKGRRVFGHTFSAEPTWTTRWRERLRLRPMWPKGALLGVLATAMLFAMAFGGGLTWAATKPSGAETRLLPQAEVPFWAVVDKPAPVPTRGARARAELQLVLPAPPAEDYLVALQSSAGDKPCSWRFVRTLPAGPSSDTRFDLKPGALQQVRVPAGHWSRLTVFSDMPGRCPVLGGKFTSGYVAAAPPQPSPPPTAASAAVQADPNDRLPSPLQGKEPQGKAPDGTEPTGKGPEGKGPEGNKPKGNEPEGNQPGSTPLPPETAAPLPSPREEVTASLPPDRPVVTDAPTPTPTPTPNPSDSSTPDPQGTISAEPARPEPVTSSS